MNLLNNNHTLTAAQLPSIICCKYKSFFVWYKYQLQNFSIRFFIVCNKYPLLSNSYALIVSKPDKVSENNVITGDKVNFLFFVANK